jgi:hypothetical protein
LEQTPGAGGGHRAAVPLLARTTVTPLERIQWTASSFTILLAAPKQSPPA